MKRLFVGIKIIPNAELLDFYTALRTALQDDKIKWVPIENFHITLKFLGDTASSLVPQIINQLENVVEKFKEFDLEVNGLGHFKKQRRTNVIWLGLKNTETLASLANKIDVSMNSIGFNLEERTFKAHLTLGRVKYFVSEKRILELIKEYKELGFQVCTINEVLLFESVLKNTGSKYTVLHSFNF